MPTQPWPPNSESAPRFRARAFAACFDDLDVDFAEATPAELVTALLARCLRDADSAPLNEAALWRWNVSERMQGLLAIAHATHGPETRAVARCVAPECRGQIELQLELAGFAWHAPTRIEWRDTAQRRLSARLPEGEDLRDWHAQAPGDAAWLARRLLIASDGAPETLDWRPDARDLAAFAQALEDADPLTALAIDVSCPYCARDMAVEVDLERLLLDGLHRRQRAVLDEVHRLASAYHWREADIVAMPAWRRHAYLARLQAEAA